jgi:hypothetical protein
MAFKANSPTCRRPVIDKGHLTSRKIYGLGRISCLQRLLSGGSTGHLASKHLVRAQATEARRSSNRKAMRGILSTLRSPQPILGLQAGHRRPAFLLLARRSRKQGPSTSRPEWQKAERGAPACSAGHVLKDTKPENVLVDAAGNALLTGFGIAS